MRIGVYLPASGHDVLENEGNWSGLWVVEYEGVFANLNIVTLALAG